MSGLLNKRSREDEPLQGSPKRFHGEQQILHLLEEDKFQEEEECFESEKIVGGVKRSVEEEIEEVVSGMRNLEEEIEEVVNGVMRSLEEEIGVKCSSYYEGSGGLSRENFVASDMTNCCGIDVEYLLGASDDELGLPPTPLLNSDAQPASFSLNEGSISGLDSAQNAELKSFLGNWQFEDDFVAYTQFSEDDAASAWDIFSPGAFIDDDYSAACRLEAAGGIY